MAPPPGPYSGTSTLALVARVSAFSVGVVYGAIKLKQKPSLNRKLMPRLITESNEIPSMH